MPQTVHRTCGLCEAICGLTFEVEGDRILSIRPDKDDVFSRGHICPKGMAIGELHGDPDRLRTPMRRVADGRFEPIGWDEALSLVAQRLSAIRSQHGRDAVGVYLGNPVVHDHGVVLMRQGFLGTLGSRNCFSAGSQDTSPRFAASHYLYGSSLVIPVPDIDRTQYLVCIGANPLVSNGSFCTAPDVRGRLRAIRERGGKVVVVDPRRSETAREASEHIAIRPGGDAALLLSMVQVLLQRERVDLNQLQQMASGWQGIEPQLAQFAPALVEKHVGIDAATIERLALEFADAPSSVAYSRIGVCNNLFGTLATWATDLLNLCAGRLGVEGGAMFPTPPIDIAQLLHLLGGDGHGRWKSRVRGLPETLGDLPAATLADEIETPGDGQVRALVTVAGNPVLSVPNGQRLDRALGTLDFMVAIDIYINETTRHADIILPPTSNLTNDHVDLLPTNHAVRNIARYSPPVLPRQPGDRHDWEILLELAERLGGGPTGTPAMDRLVRLARVVGYRWNPTSTADLAIRLGPWGDRFLPWSKGLNLKKLKAAPHGIDLGPLKPGLHRMFHADKRVHLAAAPIQTALDQLKTNLQTQPDSEELLMIGRRELRSNNSWMHNLPSMVAGRERCVLLVHPDDAQRAGIGDGQTALLESRVHSGPVRIELSDTMRPGVVSLPHGWGHAASAAWQQVAGKNAGVSANDWTDDAVVESVVGQSVLNGVPVRLRPLAA